MVKSMNDKVTLTVKELKYLFLAGVDFGRQELAKEAELTDEPDYQPDYQPDFGEYIDIHFDIELI
jgi:hypothetical protein